MIAAAVPSPAPTSRWTPAEKLGLLTLALGVLHHIDHVLRVDHSGWPFTPAVTPFTYSLSVYPAIAIILFARGWPRLRIALAGLLALFPTLAHIFLETPANQYVTWAARPERNWLGVSSPLLGVSAVVLTVLLSLCAAATFVAFVKSRGR
jgi:hypothetical protein